LFGSGCEENCCCSSTEKNCSFEDIHGKCPLKYTDNYQLNRECKLESQVNQPGKNNALALVNPTRLTANSQMRDRKFSLLYQGSV